jgi:hypothetical protein
MFFHPPQPALPFQIIVKKMAGRYRLVYQATGHVLLNLMGGPVDAGGYPSAGQAHAHAARINDGLQEILPSTPVAKALNVRALALLLC